MVYGDVEFYVFYDSEISIIASIILYLRYFERTVLLCHRSASIAVTGSTRNVAGNIYLKHCGALLTRGPGNLKSWKGRSSSTTIAR